jgi:hypothetical protein
MAKRGRRKQLSLPFEAERDDEIFRHFYPTVLECHAHQDKPNSTSGNCYDWWRSRYSEWIAKHTFSSFVEKDALDDDMICPEEL